MKGPGKYDDLCIYVREQAKAEGAIVIVLGGHKGSGFSVQLPILAADRLPTILRETADKIEKDLKGDVN